MSLFPGSQIGIFVHESCQNKAWIKALHRVIANTLVSVASKMNCIYPLNPKFINVAIFKTVRFLIKEGKVGSKSEKYLLGLKSLNFKQSYLSGQGFSCQQT